jgi:hypothetical protein
MTLSLEAKQRKALEEIEQRAESKGLTTMQQLRVVSIIEQLLWRRFAGSEHDSTLRFATPSSTTASGGGGGGGGGGVGSSNSSSRSKASTSSNAITDHLQLQHRSRGAKPSGSMCERVVGRLIRCLVPSEPHVDEEVAVQLIACLTPMTWHCKYQVVTWLSLVLDLIDHRQRHLLALYPVLFQLLQYQTLRPVLCPLLIRLTRRQHVLPFRARALLRYYEQSMPALGSHSKDSSCSLLLELLYLYQEYQADIVVMPVGYQTLKRTKVFRIADPEWHQTIVRVQNDNAVKAAMHKRLQPNPPSIADPTTTALVALPSNTSRSATTTTTTTTTTTKTRQALPLALPSQRLRLLSTKNVFARVITQQAVIPSSVTSRTQWVCLTSKYMSIAHPITHQVLIGGECSQEGQALQLPHLDKQPARASRFDPRDSIDRRVHSTCPPCSTARSVGIGHLQSLLSSLAVDATRCSV